MISARWNLAVGPMLMMGGAFVTVVGLTLLGERNAPKPQDEASLPSQQRKLWPRQHLGDLAFYWWWKHKGKLILISVSFAHTKSICMPNQPFQYVSTCNKFATSISEQIIAAFTCVWLCSRPCFTVSCFGSHTYMDWFEEINWFVCDSPCQQCG